MLVSLGQSDSVGGCLVKMRVRRVTVWKHEKFTIIPRKRWQNLTLQELIETLVVSVDCVDNGGVYWSLFSFLSMESVDQVGRRERFMQSNFESLSGGDDGTNSAATNSISNAWREGGSSAHQRNAGTIGENWGPESVLSPLSSPVVTSSSSFRRCQEAERRRAEQAARGAAEEDRGDQDETAECKLFSL